MSGVGGGYRRAADSHTPHMRRRSSRRAEPATKALKSSVELGLRSLLDADDNAHVVAKMLDVPTEKSAVVVDNLLQKLQEVMSLNGLSIEGLLGHYFDVSLLASYCSRFIYMKHGQGIEISREELLSLD